MTGYEKRGTNHTDREGNPINYIQRIFKWENYLNYTPLGQIDPELVGLKSCNNSKMINIEPHIYTNKQDCFIDNYAPCSKTLSKNLSIKFKITFNSEKDYPIIMNSWVENHGKEATNAKDLGHSRKPIKIFNPYSAKQIFWEHTAYRGLHYFIVEIKTNSNCKYKSKVGIFIE